MTIRWLALAVAVLFPQALAAAVRADFHTILTSPNYSYRGTLVIDGDRARLDITEGSHPLFNANTSIITKAGGKEIVMLDHARKTWYLRRAEGMGGHLSTSRGMGKTTGLNHQLRASREGEDHRVHLEYDLLMEIEGEQMRGRVLMDVVTSFGPPYRQRALGWGLHYAAKTGFDAIDKAIARRMPSRLPSKQVVTASRQIEGGPLVTETITTTLANFADITMRDEEFFAPSGYRYEMPVFQFGE